MPNGGLHVLELGWATTTMSQESFWRRTVACLERRLQKAYLSSISWPKKLEIAFELSNAGFEFTEAKDAM